MRFVVSQARLWFLTIFPSTTLLQLCNAFLLVWWVKGRLMWKYLPSATKFLILLTTAAETT